jgi:hypothetical protein
MVMNNLILMATKKCKEKSQPNWAGKASELRGRPINLSFSEDRDDEDGFKKPMSPLQGG